MRIWQHISTGCKVICPQFLPCLIEFNQPSSCLTHLHYNYSFPLAYAPYEVTELEIKRQKMCMFVYMIYLTFFVKIEAKESDKFESTAEVLEQLRLIQHSKPLQRFIHNILFRLLNFHGVQHSISCKLYHCWQEIEAAHRTRMNGIVSLKVSLIIVKIFLVNMLY